MKKKKAIHDMTLNFTVYTDNFHPTENDILKELVKTVRELVNHKHLIKDETKIIRSFDRSNINGLNILAERDGFMKFNTGGDVNPCNEIHLPSKSNLRQSEELEDNDGIWPTF